MGLVTINLFIKYIQHEFIGVTASLPFVVCGKMGAQTKRTFGAAEDSPGIEFAGTCFYF